MLLNDEHYTAECVLKSRGVAFYCTAASSEFVLPAFPEPENRFGSRFCFPLLCLLPCSGICPWDMLVKDILCQHLVTRHMPVLSDSLRMRPPFPVLPQPCASGVTRQGLCLLPPIDSYELVGEGCLCSTKSVLVSNMRNRVYIFPRKTDVQECEFFCFLQGTLCGCIRHGGTATLILRAKYVLEVASSTGAKYPRVHY